VTPVPLIPDSAPFNPGQRLWLNGFLAGYLAANAAAGASTAETGSPSMAAKVPLLILFGSQTGTAEKLARVIAAEARKLGCDPRVVDAATHATIDWSQAVNLFVVTSTYGDGDMPDNAQAFWDWLQTDAAAVLSRLNFSVLALGDTNYEQFCAAGRKIDARLEQLGARRVQARVDCDVDYEAAAKSWMDSALSVLTAQGALEGTASSVPDFDSNQLRQSGLGNDKAFSSSERQRGLEARTASPAYGRTNPFPARLLTNRRLNGEGSEKETRHFEISLDDSGLVYEAGDALGVHPTNCPTLVNDLLNALGCDGEEGVSVSNVGELPLRKALAGHLDLTKPSPELLRRVSEGHEILRALLAVERRDDLKHWLRGREIIDLLLEARDVRIPPPEFVSLLKKLGPRLYSISSSPKAHAGQVHLTINIVRHRSHGRSRKGVASTFLADRTGPETPVPVFVHSSPGFRLPADGNTPVLMIGPGTGVAPFRAFLHERRASGATGRNWLFFGEQRASTDFYYRDELEGMLADGHLHRLDTAFSRDQAEKIYVQHRLLERAADVWAWLQEGAHVYVCGDASRMAKDVDAALHRVVESAGGMTAEAAAGYVANLKTDKRYQRDVY